jgi:hypothetical protein
MTVELSGLFPTSDHRLRIATNMRIYWDRVRVLVGGGETDVILRRLEPLFARLEFGGFPAERSADGDPPFGYDPLTVSARSPWTTHVGRYTAFGDVREQLLEIDDALKRMDFGTYGSCANCNTEIAKARLRALPWAKYCIDCQELVERGIELEN